MEKNSIKDKLKKAEAWLIGHFVPINKKKIVFTQFGGSGYGCNPKAICEEFLRRDEGYDLVWMLNRKMKIENAHVPAGVRITRRNQTIIELMTAKVWINNIHFNDLLRAGVYKRKGTIYLNTFHGGITLKKEGKDKHSYNPNRKLPEKDKMYLKDSEYVDYITSGCEMEEHVLKEFFYGRGEILRFGDARTDVLVNGSEQIEREVREFYQIPEGTKLVIYAPTFRSDMSLKWYDLDYERVLDKLEEKYGCPWKMLIRLHPRVAKKSKKLVPDTPRYIDASGYHDMQDLAVAADLMISDYSSVITDFMLTKKPAFMYVPDLDHYLKTRGMYFEMDELPFPYARNNDEFIRCIEGFDQAKYEQKTEGLMAKLGYLADGGASRRIVDFLIQKMKE
ncbi:hypothetical protein D3Z47_07175 [Lachnospiraceae bacterium]|nr:hypothetical protein [Lachnospiraceae bacterium]